MERLYNSMNQIPNKPLAHLVKTEERIKEQAELNNNLELQTNLRTYEISILPNTKFCDLLNYQFSSCLTNNHKDSNCFETKAPGCRNYRVYIGVKKILRKENISLAVSSYINRGLDWIDHTYERGYKAIFKKVKN